MRLGTEQDASIWIPIECLQYDFRNKGCFSGSRRPLYEQKIFSPQSNANSFLFRWIKVLDKFNILWIGSLNIMGMIE